MNKYSITMDFIHKYYRMDFVQVVPETRLPKYSRRTSPTFYVDFLDTHPTLHYWHARPCSVRAISALGWAKDAFFDSHAPKYQYHAPRL